MECAPKKTVLVKRVLFYGAAALGAGLILFPQAVFAASLYLSPSTQSMVVGQTIVVTVGVSSPSQALNAVSGDISFPSDKLQVLSISKQSSIVGLWVRDPSFTNSIAGGDVHFEGIVLNPGFTGAAGPIIKVTFQAVAAGDAPISFSNGSVLANDGNGTNILNSMGTGDYSIAAASVSGTGNLEGTLPPAPIISSLTHPDQHAWYSTTTLQLSWKLPSGVTGVSYGLASTTQYILASQSRGSISGATYDLTGYGEGPWYFFIKFRNANGWGPLAVYDVNIDFSPPEPFVITETDAANNNATSQPIFQWYATDTVSGIRNYMIQVGSAAWIDAAPLAVPSTTDEYQLSPQQPGANIPIAVEAFDEAGNMTLATTTFSVSLSSAPRVIDCTLSVDASDLKSCGWFGEAVAFLLEWGALILLAALIITLIWFAVYAMAHRVRVQRLGSARELLKMREELRGDLKRLEKEFEAGGSTVKIKERIQDEIGHIEEDIKKDIGKMDNEGGAK